MIFDFNFHNPTRIYFGRTALDNLSPELNNYGIDKFVRFAKMYGK